MHLLAAYQTIALLIFCFIVCWFWQPNQNRSKANLAISLGLVVLACLHAQYIVDLSELMDVLASAGKVTAEETAKAKAITSIWAGIASLIVGGIGVNLLSSWFDS